MSVDSSLRTIDARHGRSRSLRLRTRNSSGRLLYGSVASTIASPIASPAKRDSLFEDDYDDDDDDEEEEEDDQDTNDESLVSKHSLSNYYVCKVITQEF